MKQDGNFAHFWEGGKWWVSACTITTTTETLTTYKCCLFKPGNFLLKTPACFSISFELGILSEIIIWSFDNVHWAQKFPIGKAHCWTDMYLVRFLSCMFLWISWIYLNFAVLRPRQISEALRGGVVTVVFHFPGVVSYCFVLYKVITTNSGVGCVVL